MPDRIARSLGWACLALTIGTAPALAQTAPTESQQRLACLGDAFRLCSTYIPDRTAIRACLGTHHRELSEGCRVVYNASIKAGQ